VASRTSVSRPAARSPRSTRAIWAGSISAAAPSARRLSPASSRSRRSSRPNARRISRLVRSTWRRLLGSIQVSPLGRGGSLRPAGLASVAARRTRLGRGPPDPPRSTPSPDPPVAPQSAFPDLAAPYPAVTDGAWRCVTWWTTVRVMSARVLLVRGQAGHERLLRPWLSDFADSQATRRSRPEPAAPDAPRRSDPGAAPIEPAEPGTGTMAAESPSRSREATCGRPSSRPRKPRRSLPASCAEPNIRPV
jgi:hypothetical protein